MIKAMKVVAARDHENADRLRVYQFEAPGTGQVQIIANKDVVYHVGDVAAVANIGTVLEDGTEIKKNKFRGIRSYGMAMGKTDADVGTDLIAMVMQDIQVGLETN